MRKILFGCFTAFALSANVSVPGDDYSKVESSGIEVIFANEYYALAKEALAQEKQILKDYETQLSVFLHELAHFISDYGDNTREFEKELTNMIGYFASLK